MHTAFGQVNSHTQCHFTEMNRIGRGTAERSAAIVQNCLQAAFCGSSATWNTEAAQPLAGLVCRPEPQEGAEGKREVDPVAGNDAGCLEYPHPVVDHPTPGFGGV